MIQAPLVLGEFVFDETELEAPDNIGDLAGTQSVAQHDFPGGIRTQQVFGYFPAPVRWRAHFSGANASDRAEQVKRILYAGQEISLSWGERSWLGRLVRFSPFGRHTWLFDYEVEFWPRLDTSSGASATPAQPDLDTIMALHALALASALATTDGVFFPFIAATVTAPLQGLLAAVAVATIAAGSIALMTDAQRLAIQTASEAVLLATAPLQVALDPIISSPAWDIASRAAVIANIVSTAATARWVIPVVNPNLMLLSAQYYGDAALWQTIAAANALDDPMPIGNFQLLIPPPPPA